MRFLSEISSADFAQRAVSPVASPHGSSVPNSSFQLNPPTPVARAD